MSVNFITAFFFLCQDRNVFGFPTFNELPDCLTIFFCSEQLGLFSFDEIKKGFVNAFFNKSNTNVGFHGLEMHMKEYLDVFKPSQGLLGDGSNHLSEFMSFVKQNPVRSCLCLTLSYRSLRLVLLLFVLQYVFQFAIAFNFVVVKNSLNTADFFVFLQKVGTSSAAAAAISSVETKQGLLTCRMARRQRKVAKIVARYAPGMETCLGCVDSGEGCRANESLLAVPGATVPEVRAQALLDAVTSRAASFGRTPDCAAALAADGNNSSQQPFACLPLPHAMPAPCPAGVSRVILSLFLICRSLLFLCCRKSM